MFYLSSAYLLHVIFDRLTTTHSHVFMIKPALFRAFVSIVFGIGLTSISVNGQKTDFRYFGHIEAIVEQEEGSDLLSTFSLGEHDLFINSRITDRISFLGETVVTLNSAGTFRASIERARIKFDYLENHSVILGKMHTPLDYWNDVYHHGRLFFPTIDRPQVFGVFMPVHTLGLRLQGQNIGKWGFGYDVVLGNGISSTDFSDDGIGKSFTAAFHFKPVKEMRFGASYYRDVLKNNRASAHSGHVNPFHQIMAERYPKDIVFDIVAGSFAYFGNRFETLVEGFYNASTSDSLGRADNSTFFTYLGYRPKKNLLGQEDKNVYFMLVDYINIAHNDLHSMPMEVLKLGLGTRYDFSYLVNMKFQVERYFSYHQMAMHGHTVPNKWEVKIQVAYGF